MYILIKFDSPHPKVKWPSNVHIVRIWFIGVCKLVDGLKDLRVAEVFWEMEKDFKKELEGCERK